MYVGATAGVLDRATQSSHLAHNEPQKNSVILLGGLPAVQDGPKTLEAADPEAAG
jgi:hypothetical protein